MTLQNKHAVACTRVNTVCLQLEQAFETLLAERKLDTDVLEETLGTLRSNDVDGKENVKKTIGFINKTKTLHVHHAFLYISLPVFALLRREHA